MDNKSKSAAPEADLDNLENLATQEPIDSLDFSVSVWKNKKNSNSFNKLKTYIENANNYYKNSDYEIVNFKSKIVKFSFLFLRFSFWKQLVLLIVLSLSMSVFTLFLIQNSGLYSAGVSGIFQGIARLTQIIMYKNNAPAEIIDPVYNAIFWGSYFLANIPLIFFAYKKISKRFAILTIIYILFNQLFGYSLSFIPNIHSIQIFGNTYLQMDNEIAKLVGLQITAWDSGNGAFSLMIYSAACAILIGFQYSMLYIIGSSTGGTDVVSFYFAKKKNKNIASSLASINLTCIFISVMIGSFTSLMIIDPSISEDPNKLIQFIFSPNLIFSIFLVIISSIELNYLFPRSKFTQIKIYTKDSFALKNNLIMAGYKHDIFINQMHDLNDEPVYTLETICMYIELPNVLSTIRSVDKSSTISINRLSDIDGDMYTIK